MKSQPPPAAATTSRRRFLQSALAASAAPMIIPATALGKGGRPAPSERITMACFGFGTIAHSTARNFLNDERVQTVAIADPARDLPGYGYSGELRGGREEGKRVVEAHYAKAKESGEYKGCATYGDFRELLEKEDVDAINICTPDHWHAILAIAAARAGKHIYGQKPLSLTVAGGRRMVEEVTKAGITWQTGSQQRSDAKFRKACELVVNGRIGKVHTVKVGLPGGHNNWNQMADKKDPAPVPEGLDFEMWEGPAPHRDYRPALLPLQWRHNYDYSGGMVTDFGAHHIDIAQWGMETQLTGPVRFEKIKGTMPDKDALYNTATKFYFECIYENGIRMIVSDANPTGITFEGEGGKSIYCNRGVLESNPEEIRRGKIEEGDKRLYESNNHERNFIDCVYSGEPTAAPIEVAHRTITIAHLANLGLRLGKSEFAWDPKAEKSGDSEVDAMLSRPLRAPWSLA